MPSILADMQWTYELRKKRKKPTSKEQKIKKASRKRAKIARKKSRR